MILKAQKAGYAIGSFNTSDLETTKAIVAAAEKTNSPCIIETSEKAIAYAGLEYIGEIIKTAAENTHIPLALHLDHGTSIKMIHDCIEAGYTSLMFDGSKLNFQENIAKTKQAADLAHKNNLPIEGELGIMGKAGLSESEMTNPNDVPEFIQKTGIDFLAISIGSKHGRGGAEEESLDIEHLKKIRLKTDLPLVLHGGSGVPDEDIRKAIQNGIAKINIDTDIRFTFAKTMKKILDKKSKIIDPRDILSPAMIAVEKLVIEKIRLFGSENQAAS